MSEARGGAGVKRQWLRTGQVMRRFGWSYSTLYRRVQEGYLHPRNDRPRGARPSLLFDPAEVDQLAEEIEKTNEELR